MKIKELFEKAENGVLTYDQFVAAAGEAKAKFVDLGEGEYVAKGKYSDDLASKDTQIETLRGDLTKRDEDLKALQTKLEEAGNDADKLSQISTEFTNLQTKYDADMKDYQAKLSKQQYEFAVKEFAGTKAFTSNAAKRDFINGMMSENLKIKDGVIIGADDFVTAYSKDNADAFVVESDPSSNPNPEDNKPKFSDKTPGAETGGEENLFKFNFTGVRPVE